ncbi:amidohydrolase family protein [bacterium]|nr:amidohydrolase family protein [bacterium]
MIRLILLLFIATTLQLHAQETYPVNGTRELPLKEVVYTHANVQVNSDVLLKDACLHVKDGKIVGIYESYKKLKGVPEINLSGAYIYPSFIDLYSDYGIEHSPKKDHNKAPQFTSDKPGPYSWNEAVHPETNASEMFHSDKKSAERYRSMGFGLVLTHLEDGIFRGTGSLVNTAEQSDLIAMEFPQAASAMSFYKGSSSQDYPRSQMGAIALIRQTYYDAQWYSRQSDEINLSLSALNTQSKLPAIFEIKDPQDVFRVYRIAEEFNKTYIVKASGYEYRWIEDLEKVKERVQFILPLTFDKAPKVSNPLLADMVSTTQLYDYYYGPHNARIMNEHGHTFCFTAHGLKSDKEFFAALKKLKESGLNEEAILKALIETPAQLINHPELAGIKIGSTAHFFITDGSIFDDHVSILTTVIKDLEYKNTDLIHHSIPGKYQFSLNGETIELDIHKPLNKPSIKLKTGKAKFISLEHEYAFVMSINDINYQVNLSGNQLVASTLDNNTVSSIVLNKIGPVDEPEKDTTELKPKVLPVPFSMDYAYVDPSESYYAITNVTIWTCEKEGIVEEGTVIIQNGKIKACGVNVKVPNGAKEIDGTGMHLTPGIIDEHSHIAIYRGVNEGTQAVTSEVRIGDVLNAQDINIYRQLSGGVTSSHLLHGSANPIGGQTALIKMRYGGSALDLTFDPDFKFIKFALGENVKQTNWGDHQTVRYPQTRMGVEQVFVDAFTRATSYKLIDPEFRRVDLELEALVEIMESERFITCHSYQQGEINMLMHVADSFGFTVNTFTHVLEGYKVADKLAEHGAAASTFADWWAYKYEVIDAIPYNAALLQKSGVLTAINSDDAEMGRRLNQEAAKTIKYGGLSEIEALKLVTINPAKMLHIDDRVGSIKVGKDADLVLWTAHPLSLYAQVHTTFVDGLIYYNIDMDRIAREQIAKRRAAMISGLSDVKQTADPKPEENRMYHCDDNEDENN